MYHSLMGATPKPGSLARPLNTVSMMRSRFTAYCKACRKRRSRKTFARAGSFASKLNDQCGGLPNSALLRWILKGAPATSFCFRCGNWAPLMLT